MPILLFSFLLNHNKSEKTLSKSKSIERGANEFAYESNNLLTANFQQHFYRQDGFPTGR